MRHMQHMQTDLIGIMCGFDSGELLKWVSFYWLLLKIHWIFIHQKFQLRIEFQRLQISKIVGGNYNFRNLWRYIYSPAGSNTCIHVIDLERRNFRKKHNGCRGSLPSALCNINSALVHRSKRVGIVPRVGACIIRNNSLPLRRVCYVTTSQLSTYAYYVQTSYTYYYGCGWWNWVTCDGYVSNNASMSPQY